MRIPNNQLDEKMISVVIPLYNKAADIEATLRSILCQSYQDFEVVVVNDGSTDGSAEIVRALMVENARIRLFDQANQGVSAARNKGISEASGDYVALIDGDDIWDKDCLRELNNLTHDFPEAAMCGVNYGYLTKGNVEECHQGMPEGFRDYVTDYFSSSHGDLFCSSSVIIKREIAISAGLFDERIRYSEDMDFWYRIILNHKVAFYNRVLAYYKEDASNRAEIDPDAHFEITQRLDYYIDKYVPYYAEHPDFARFIGMRVAYNILHGGYYFGTRYDRECTNHIVKFLSYQDIPAKYRYIFKTPRPVGWCVYQLSLLKKRIFYTR